MFDHLAWDKTADPTQSSLRIGTMPVGLVSVTPVEGASVPAAHTLLGAFDTLQLQANALTDFAEATPDTILSRQIFETVDDVCVLLGNGGDIRRICMELLPTWRD